MVHTPDENQYATVGKRVVDKVSTKMTKKYENDVDGELGKLDIPLTKKQLIISTPIAVVASMWLGSAIFGGMSKDEHGEAVADLNNQITQLSQQLKAANQRASQGNRTVKVVDDAPDLYSEAMVLDDAKGRRIFTLPLEFAASIRNRSEIAEMYADARASIYIGSETSLTFAENADWVTTNKGKYPGMRITGYVDQTEITVKANGNQEPGSAALYGATQAALRDAVNYAGKKQIAYRFQVVAGEQNTLQLIRDIGDDKKENTEAGDWEVIYSAGLPNPVVEQEKPAEQETTKKSETGLVRTQYVNEELSNNSTFDI